MGTIHVPRQADLTHIADYMGGSAAWIPAGGGASISGSSIGTGGEITISPISVYGNNIKVYYSLTADFSLYVIDDATGAVLSSTGVTGFSMSPVTINMLSTPHSSTIRLRAITATTTPGLIDITSVVTPQDTTVPVNILANVCNGGGYRYGYNGQMKENEIAGVGNHYSALYWEYDSRIGRRWNIDPVLKDGESPYACFSDQPITISDVEGDDGWDVAAGWAMGLITNIIPGSGEWRDSYAPTDAADYNNGLRGADNTTLGVGMIGAAHGGGMMAAGGTTAAAGGAVAATGVGAPAGVAIAGTGGAIAAVGAGEVAAGTYLMASAGNNKSRGYNRGKSQPSSSSSNSPTPTKLSKVPKSEKI